MARKKKEKPQTRIAVIDFETDPFLYDRVPEPFSAGFYDGETYIDFWGDDCADQLICYLESRKDNLIIYAHNGGKFDFYFLLKFGVIQNPALIINGRIVKCKFMERHELRDSIAILPLPLSKLGAKLEIDYKKLERKNRDKNKAEILEYQKADCVELHKVIMAFHARFGDNLTIGGTAIKEIRKYHPVLKQDENHDSKFRNYYFGGRVQCFEKGEIKPASGTLKIIDVNSMYPDVMASCEHPRGAYYINQLNVPLSEFNHKTGTLKKWPSAFYFIRFIGHNKNALPSRDTKTKKLSFDDEYGEFYACCHEVKAACELGLIKIEQILEINVACATFNFKTFVDDYSAQKAEAKLSGDYVQEIFTKLIMNSGYGKYATDPNKFKEFFILDTDNQEQLIEFAEWAKENHAELINDMGQYEIWQCAAENDGQGYFDVAVGASITSAARAKLLRAIHTVKRPVYCDTDSLVCENTANLILDNVKLGAWKLEGETHLIYVAGKKMYACIDLKGKEKKASKGAKLSYDEIKSVALGESVFWRSDAPAFKLSGKVNFVSRQIKMT